MFRMFYLTAYIMSAVLTLLSFESIDFNKILKTSKPFQARLLYVVLALSLTHLFAQFIINFAELTGILR